MRKCPYAIVSLVLGIISFIQLLGLEKAIFAVIFGAIALWRISVVPELRGRWQATVGLILGIIYIILVIVFFPQIMQIINKLTV